MHNLALALSERGDTTITGSDDAIFEPSRSRLAAAGILPAAEGWFPEKITKDLDAIVLGMHARADNPELLRAQALGLPIFSYPEYLYESTKGKTRVVIGGSHGKTSTTSMLLHALRLDGMDIDYMVGAQLAGYQTMVRLSNTAEWERLRGAGSRGRQAAQILASLAEASPEPALRAQPPAGAGGAKPRRIVFSVTVLGTMNWRRYSGPPALLPIPLIRWPPKGCRLTRAPVIPRLR